MFDGWQTTSIGPIFENDPSIPDIHFQVHITLFDGVLSSVINDEVIRLHLQKSQLKFLSLGGFPQCIGDKPLHLYKTYQDVQFEEIA